MPCESWENQPHTGREQEKDIISMPPPFHRWPEEDKRLWRELCESTYGGNLQRVKEIIAERPEFLFHRPENNVLRAAASAGHLQLVKFFCEQGVPLDSEDDLYPPPIGAAASERHFEIVRYLCERGAPLAAKYPHHDPLYSA
ncbi:MAG: hypothetical protein D6741_16035, partial [Planctomycetota bacterium]